ncbi:coiled-coil domain-containing protein 93-like [Polyodon spathula]|uniref:coiled-coil domain-containing protein 93-like n=1 Tax=Polyodon spathula TaxID=7913 RepID=UPI001B7F2EEF|nr:coiled-coil domain-containing protein 93-like [Polyodon spathula]
MAATSVFQRLRTGSKLGAQYDQEGNLIQVETREDEEQNVKLAEILELLVAAGYFRARIKGLSPFDKVVGGMTWCITTCNFDIDVDLLFQENSTIGQKIALTEKIVSVLPKMKCPHRLEPHQIQGLDFIHIFPVVQWKKKRAIETNKWVGRDYIRAYSVSQFQKTHSIPEDNDFMQRKEKAIKTVMDVSEVYKPLRKYKRQVDAEELVDEESRVHSTLLEYGRLPDYILLTCLFCVMACVCVCASVLQKLRALVAMNENLKNQEQEFRTHCREEMTRLQQSIENLKIESGDDDGEEKERNQLIDKQYNTDKEKLQKIRLLLARRNREIAILQRKIDEVPSRAELTQYQKRFIELYGQVAATHKETKQFFTLYNTLDDKKVFLEKEVNLLNSIHDNFLQAMASSGAREQFLRQMEQIVEGIKQNRIKMEKKKQENKMRRDQLNDEYLELLEKQRLYFKTVKDFKEECRKNEMLLSKLRAKGAS